ncbi:MAG: hypothetical protein QOE70_4624 [Chthoniobacter sp.]|nr:hypothetical protein [Chthoniobacter sp.]
MALRLQGEVSGPALATNAGPAVWAGGRTARGSRPRMGAGYFRRQTRARGRSRGASRSARRVRGLRARNPGAAEASRFRRRRRSGCGQNCGAHEPSKAAGLAGSNRTSSRRVPPQWGHLRSGSSSGRRWLLRLAPAGRRSAAQPRPRSPGRRAPGPDAAVGAVPLRDGGNACLHQHDDERRHHDRHEGGGGVGNLLPLKRGDRQRSGSSSATSWTQRWRASAT